MRYFSPQIATFIGLLMLVAIGVSAVFLLPQSIRLDESQSLWQSGHSIPGIFHTVGQDVHVPFYHILLHIWQDFFGNGIATDRLLSLLFFLLSIPAIYILTRYAFSESVALYATLIFTISPFMNWYGNELRMYSLLTLLTIINHFFFLKIFREKDRATLGTWWAYGATVVLGAYTHYFFLLTLAAEVVFFFIHRRDFGRNALKRFIICAVVLVAAFAPWLVYVADLGFAANSRPLIPPPSLIILFNTFSNFVFGFQTDQINSLLLALWPIAMLLGFLGLQRGRKIEPEATFFFLALFLPVALTFTASYVLRPVYLSRYLVLTLPSLYILLSWLFSRYRPTTASIVKNALAGLMILTMVIQTVSAQTPVKENYKAVSDYLSTHASPQDIIVVSAPFTVYPIEYYYEGETRIDTLPLWDRTKVGPIPAFNQEQLPNQVKQLTGSYQKVWLVLSYDQGYEESIRLYFDNHYQRLESINFSPKLNLYSYRLRYDQPDVKNAVSQISLAAAGAGVATSTQRRK